MEGNLRFKIDWASLIVRRTFTIFALFYFVFEGNFTSTNPGGSYIWRGNLTEGFCITGLGAYNYLEGLIFGILRYSQLLLVILVINKNCCIVNLFYCQVEYHWPTLAHLRQNIC